MTLFDTLGFGSPDRPPRFADACDREIREELEFHLAQRIEDNLADGMSEQDAQADARERFGDFERIVSDCRREAMPLKMLLLKLNVVVSIVLAIAFMFSLVETRENVARAEQARAEAMTVHARLEEELRVAQEQAIPPAPEEIVIRVGDEIELRDMMGYVETATETVARDGKLLVTPLGWFEVAGLSREAAETALTEKLLEYYQDVNVKLIVRR